MFPSGRSRLAPTNRRHTWPRARCETEAHVSLRLGEDVDAELVLTRVPSLRRVRYAPPDGEE